MIELAYPPFAPKIITIPISIKTPNLHRQPAGYDRQDLAIKTYRGGQQATMKWKYLLSLPLRIGA